ncbi:pilus assembly protein PilX [Pseudomonas sp. UL073]|uniref:Pilus assembly protein PilX n=1 Tax=Zestomonas insulae TaxID=2809017 RepID=A0ABS2IJ56_9GAMM|nr:PilX N-terminal domain-containing pilus assembly protein [Pseudomonas insulae]MBM7063101.1 pilus assembly protein PilX [Pseudomonas insulae]
MNKNLVKSAGSSPQTQRGASLLIALVILLVVTVLALSSARETTLESRITGNLVEQQKLINAAESGLRDGELGMTARIRPLEPTDDCATASAGTVPAPCLLKLASTGYSYAMLFSTAGKSRPYYPKDATTPETNFAIAWYGLPAPSGGESGEAENPEYGNMLNQTGIFRYEINSQAANNVTGNADAIRSTTAKLFDNGN